MRRTILFLLLSALTAFAQYGGDKSNTIPASGGGMSIVQAVANNNFGTSATAAFGSNVTNGNYIYEVHAVNTTSVTALPTCGAGSATVSWTTIASGTVPTTSTSYAMNKGHVTATGSCTLTASQTGSSANFTVNGWEISGSTGTADGTGAVTYAFCSGTCNGASYATSNNVDIVLSVVRGNTTSTTFTINSPFTLDAGSGNVGGVAQAGAYYNQSATGTRTINWTESTGQDYFTSILGVY